MSRGLAPDWFRIGPGLATQPTLGRDGSFEFSPCRHSRPSGAGRASRRACPCGCRFLARWIRRRRRLLRALRLLDHGPAARRSPGQRLGFADRLLRAPRAADPARRCADAARDKYCGILPAELPASERRRPGQPLRSRLRGELPVCSAWDGLLRPGRASIAAPPLLVIRRRGAVLSRLARAALDRDLRTCAHATSTSGWTAAAPAAVARRDAALGNLTRLVRAPHVDAAACGVLLSAHTRVGAWAWRRTRRRRVDARARAAGWQARHGLDRAAGDRLGDRPSRLAVGRLLALRPCVSSEIVHMPSTFGTGPS